ncbi:MAG TPA: fumarylacetoacetate hydrolase family protein [Acidimicrobiales bacterium]|nr:fumarylacetoacetate hydrolase family protein [Acidimicrobiales bacterium]
MKLARWAGSSGPVVGVVESDGTRARPVAGTVLEVLASGGGEPVGDAVDLLSIDLLPPVDPPGAVRDFYAFERHVATARARRGLEMEPGWYERPVFYFSNPSVLLGGGATVPVPPRASELDFELELAWVIGEDGGVAGYTVMNDWSARDLQREEMKLSLGPAKGKDFATSLGPVLVTPDELVADATMRAWVNGRQYSEATIDECWWTVAEMTAYAAEASLVRPGDVFGSGTCGTGCILELALTHGGDAYPWLAEGDEVVLEIDGIGRLTNIIGSKAGRAWAVDAGVTRPAGMGG